MADLPSGTVTFLFTDIEGSTARAIELGDEDYADALRTHRDLLRRSFVAHDGVEVSTEGDAFFVAFARARDALAAACGGQQALAAHQWSPGARLRVRMGLHTGEVLVRDDDYVGHEVHRAKRICDVGHGGQILVSETTATLAGPNRPTGTALVDLGQHRLKDLGQPQRLFQLSVPDLPERFPPLRSLESFANNLPAQRTSFVGRESQIAELIKLLRDHRLVTLTGVGGCGKTRLALQVGAELLEEYPDGVFFADLAGVTDPDGVPAAVATAVGVPAVDEMGPGPRPGARQLLLAFQTRRRSLIILDNCEHLLDAAAELVDVLLEGCPDVSLLATSREALEVDGEQSWRVPSLSLPAASGPAESESVELFVSRARAVRPDFQLSDRNGSAVEDICRRLDGIPLAIEFAAARVAHLSPEEISARLGDMFSLLAGGRRRRVQRQQTLQAALDWSYELLSEQEQRLLRELGVFPSTFDLAAAGGICGHEGLDLLDMLGSLVAKSLVTTVDGISESTRYRLIEPVRAYAATKLREAGDADEIRTRHRDWYLTYVRAVPLEIVLAYKQALALGTEYANLQAALEWSEAEGRHDLVVEIALRCGSMWTVFGRHDEGFRWLTVARPEDLDLADEEKIAALAYSAFLAQALQRNDGAGFADRAIVLGTGTTSGFLVRALCQRALGDAIAGLQTTDLELYSRSRARLEEALEAAGQRSVLRGYVDDYRGMIDHMWGDHAAAVEPHRSSVRLSANALIYVPISYHLLGDHPAALQVVNLMLRDDISSRNPQRVIAVAVARAGAGDLAGARTELRATLDDAIRYPAGLEIMAVGAAVVAFIDGDLERASRLFGWVRARTFDAGRIIPAAGGYALYVHYVPLVRAGLDSGTARRCLHEGRSWSEADLLSHLRDGGSEA